MDTWAAEMEVDYPNLTFTITKVYKIETVNDITHTPKPYTIVSAGDELGAFSAAARVMQRLNLSQAR